MCIWSLISSALNIKKMEDVMSTLLQSVALRGVVRSGGLLVIVSSGGLLSWGIARSVFNFSQLHFMITDFLDLLYYYWARRPVVVYGGTTLLHCCARCVIPTATTSSRCPLPLVQDVQRRACWGHDGRVRYEGSSFRDSMLTVTTSLQRTGQRRD